MSVRNMRLAVGLFFLVTGVALLALLVFKPEAAGKLNSPTRLFIGALLALVLSGVNLAKWYASWLAFQQSATPVRQPLQPDPLAER
ncbi:MAG: hypothetical protein L0241_12480, partial [Planctomycetia bacterium]|nr:hypothetical protein [Planctomycetia bacterium]